MQDPGIEVEVKAGEDTPSPSTASHCAVAVECEDGVISLHEAEYEHAAVLRNLLAHSSMMAVLYPEGPPADCYSCGSLSRPALLLAVTIVAAAQQDLDAVTQLPWKAHYSPELLWQAHLAYLTLDIQPGGAPRALPETLLEVLVRAFTLRVEGFSSLLVLEHSMEDNPWREATAYVMVQAQQPWTATGPPVPPDHEEGSPFPPATGPWVRLPDGRWHGSPLVEEDDVAQPQDPPRWPPPLWMMLEMLATLTLRGHLTIPPEQYTPVALFGMALPLVAGLERSFHAARESRARPFAYEMRKRWPLLATPEVAAAFPICAALWLLCAHEDALTMEEVLRGVGWMSRHEGDMRSRLDDCFPEALGARIRRFLRCQPEDAFFLPPPPDGAHGPKLRPFSAVLHRQAFLAHVASVPRLADALTALMTRVTTAQAERRNATLRQDSTWFSVATASGDTWESRLWSAFTYDAAYRTGIIGLRLPQELPLLYDAASLRALCVNPDLRHATLTVHGVLSALQQDRDMSPNWMPNSLGQAGIARIHPSVHALPGDQGQTPRRVVYFPFMRTVYADLQTVRRELFLLLTANNAHGKCFPEYVAQVERGDACLATGEAHIMAQVFRVAGPMAPAGSAEMQVQVRRRFAAMQAILHGVDTGPWHLNRLSFDHIKAVTKVREMELPALHPCTQISQEPQEPQGPEGGP